MRGRGALLCLLALLLAALPACVRIEPEISGTPTPSTTPTPTPAPFVLETTAAPVPTDLLGNRVEMDDHYFRYYLSFGDLRVYEYGTGTFLDGVCVNAYPLPLDGVVNIVYRSEDGRVCGTGRIHNAEGGTVLESGSNAIYAEILTDIDVQGMDFTLEIETPFTPVEPETAAGGNGA